MLVATPAGQQAIAAALDAHVTSGTYTGPFYGAQVAISTVALPQGVPLAYSAITLPVYTGYADQAVTWTGPIRLDNGDYGLLGNELTFQQTSTITQTVCTSYALYTGSSPNQVVLAVENFATAKDLNDAFDALIFTPVLDMPITFMSGAIVVN